MYSLKRGRGPSMAGGIGGLVMGLFGILWTVGAMSIVVGSRAPVIIQIIFPMFGVIFTLICFGGAIYNFTNATSQQRFAEYDFVSHQDEPDPLNLRFGSPQSPPDAAGVTKFCAQCGHGLQESFRFCPSCGTKVSV